MKMNNTRKLTWVLCGVGCLIAVIGIFFLPDTIPIHFSHGAADEYTGKPAIFLFPALQILFAFLTGRKKIKNFLTHAKTPLTDTQFQWIIDGVLILVLVVEVWVVCASFM